MLLLECMIYIRGPNPIALTFRKIDCLNIVLESCLTENHVLEPHCIFIFHFIKLKGGCLWFVYLMGRPMYAYVSLHMCV